MKIKVIILAIILCFAALGASAQTTEFSFQGSLKDTGIAANGNYDFEFRLFDAAGGGSQIGPTISKPGTAVANGIFSVNLDFGNGFPGGDRYLEVRVRIAGAAGFTNLDPRQRVASAPYSIKSLSADTANSANTAATAVNATNAVNSANFTGNLAGDVTGTQTAATVARLQGRNVSTAAPTGGQVLKYNGGTNQWEPATPDAGSGGTITGVTAGAGLTGGGTTGNVPIAVANGGVGTSQLADGGVTDPKISSVSGAKVSGAVASATNATTAATANNALQLGGVPAARFVQSDAGGNVSIGGNLTVSGTVTQPIVNALTEYQIGGQRVLKTDQSTANTFGGLFAGLSNTSGCCNVFFGESAGRFDTTGFFNSYFGYDAGRMTTTGDSNSFFGVRSGQNTTTGNANSFFGREAGVFNTAGFYNSFFGNESGFRNTNGARNAFFGNFAGFNNTIGNENAFFGYNAGANNSEGINNSFFGVSAGVTNSTGGNNTAVGNGADFGANNLNFATAIGAGAVVNASNSMVLGRNSDTVNVPGNLNVIGTLSANINGASITNLNAANIATGTLNSARLGVIPIANGGTGSATQNFVDLTTGQTIGGNKTFSNTLSGNVVNSVTDFRIGGNRILSTPGTTNIFAGLNAGLANPTGIQNTFFGGEAGKSDTQGGDNSFFGYHAGNSNTTAFHNTFVGGFAGDVSTSGSSNSFFGTQAGFSNTQGDNNTFIGSEAGFANTTGDNNTGIGYLASVGSNLSFATAVGARATASTSNSIVLGRSDGSDTVRVPGNINVTGSTSLNGNLTFASGGLASINGTNVFMPSLPAGVGTTLCRSNSNQIITCSSSLRYKTHIGSFNFGLDLIKRLRPITFDWKAGGTHDLGLGAEDVAAIEPLLVTYNDKGQVEGVKYDRIGVVLINAVKEQQAQISAQKDEISAQKAMISKQQAAIDSLKKLVCLRNKKAGICKE